MIVSAALKKIAFASLVSFAAFVPASAQDTAPSSAPASAPTPSPEQQSAPGAPAPAAPAASVPNAGAAPSPTPAPASASTNASGEPEAPKHMPWSFDGPFGMYDRAALQRGFQVYKEVCSACHALSHIAFRNLGDAGGPGFSEAEVRAIAAAYNMPAGPNEQGQTVDAKGQTLMRPATPADYFPPPFANEQAARAANNGALPPDLSLIVKAREGGANYVYSIVTGDTQRPPAGTAMARGMYFDAYFPGHQIAMPPPLRNGSVMYMDGTPNTLEQEAHDVVTFLAWASEPKMEDRKRIGLDVLAFLLVFTGLLYLSYRKVWHGHHDVGATGSGLEKH